MKNREWQAIEYEIVSKMANAAKTDIEIGNILSRTDREIFLARKRMGIPSLNSNTANPWTIDDIKTLQAWFDMGRSDGEIAHTLHRTVDSIASKRKALGLQRVVTVGAYGRPIKRGIQASEVLGRRPLAIDETDYTKRAYATTAFLISLLRAGHKPGQGEFHIPSEARVVRPSDLVGA